MLLAQRAGVSTCPPLLWLLEPTALHIWVSVIRPPPRSDPTLDTQLGLRLSRKGLGDARRVE